MGTGRWRAHVAIVVGALVLAGCAEGVVDEAPATATPGTEGPAAEADGASTVGELTDGAEPGPRCPAASIDREGLAARAREFALRHGVETTIAFDGCPPDEHVTCEAVRAREYVSVATFLDQVEGDLEIYPRDFFRTIHLDVIVFGRNLSTSGAEHHALGGAVIPHGEDRSVLFVSTTQARHCLASLNRRTLHHEIGHAIDFGLARVSDAGWWPLLNPADFTYGGVDLDAPGLLDVDHPGPGLVSRYAQASVGEDHAEVYAVMFMPEHGNQLRGWVREDRWLAAKFRNMLRPLEVTWPEFVHAMPNYDALP